MDHTTDIFEVCCHAFMLGCIVGILYEIVNGFVISKPFDQLRYVLACQVECEGYGVEGDLSGENEKDTNTIATHEFHLDEGGESAGLSCQGWLPLVRVLQHQLGLSSHAVRHNLGCRRSQQHPYG